MPIRTAWAQAEEARKKSRRTWLTACLIGCGVTVVIVIVGIVIVITALNSFSQACSKL